MGSLFDYLGFDVSMFVFLPNLPFDLAIGLWLILIPGVVANLG
jgi:hypothetical protein